MAVRARELNNGHERSGFGTHGTRATKSSHGDRRSRAGGIDKKGSSHSLASVTESNEEDSTPSRTTTRLRALARSVRAAQTLGTLRTKKKYMLTSGGSPLSTARAQNDEEYMNEEVGSVEFAMFLLSGEAGDPSGQISARSTSSNNNAGANLADFMLSGGGRPAPSGAVGGPGPSAAGANRSRWKTAGKAALASRGSFQGGPPHGSNNNHGPTSARGKRGGRADGAYVGMPFDPYASQSQLQPLGVDVPENLEARVSCARSLYKLSCQPGNERAIIQGGAITQIADFSDVENLKIQEYCAAILANLTTEAPALHSFVLMDGISSLLELSWSPSIEVKTLCATGLCRLSMHAAFAAALSRARSIIELLSMLTLPHDQLQMLVVTCVLNLIYHGHLFPERIFVGEPHALQNQLGVMSVVGQLASSPLTMQFATEVLFNLSLYRISCCGALRGGGAEILHAIATHVTKSLDDSNGAGSSRSATSLMGSSMNSSRSSSSSSSSSSMNAILMLQLIADTLGNFSAYSEFHNLVSLHGLKTLSLLLVGPLQILGSKSQGANAEERLSLVAVSCSRALANFSSNDDLRRHVFHQDIVQMATRLCLMNRQIVAARSTSEGNAFLRNAVRTIHNLSFHEAATAYFMEFPQILPLLHAIVVGKCDLRPTSADHHVAHGVHTAHGHSHSVDYHSTIPTASSEPLEEDIKEDALITILNLAQQAAYSNDLLKILDGKLLARAADAPLHSRRLRYIYAMVMCNLLFENRMQQVVYGDQVVNTLVRAFNHFVPPTSVTQDAMTLDSNPEYLQLSAQNLAFADDQERFLAALCIIASEIMDQGNIERAVTLILDCLQVNLAGSKTWMNPQARAARRPLMAYASCALYTLARSSTQRGDTSNIIYSHSTEAALIAVCESAAAATPSSQQPESATSGGYYCGMTQAFCAATLYHICASGHVNTRIVQALIDSCNANEETQSLLACSASFAIISFTAEGRKRLLGCRDLAKALNRLGRTSQVECQQYAAIAACNVSSIECIWTSAELKDFIVVALLRANSLQAKQIHAKTLSNLLSHPASRPKAVEDGVLYALMKLSQVSSSNGHNTNITEDVDATTLHNAVFQSLGVELTSNAEEVLSLGLQALFNLSCEKQYHQKLLSNGVIAYLSAAVAGRSASSVLKPSDSSMSISSSTTALASATSILFANPLLGPAFLNHESRRYAMGIICNLSSYEENHKELINGQVTDVIRKYVDQDVETRASASMALRNLSCRQPWVELLCERKTLQLFIQFTHSDHLVVRRFAIQGLANCSLVTDSLHLFGELKVSKAVLTLLETCVIPPERQSSDSMLLSHQQHQQQRPHELDMETCMAALKCLHNMSIDETLASKLMDDNCALRLQPLLGSYELGTHEDASLMAASIISILAGKTQCADALLKQRVVSFCALLHRTHASNSSIAFECVNILMKMSTYQHIQIHLVETQAIQVIVGICSTKFTTVNTRIRECGAITIRNLSLCVVEHLSMFYEDTSWSEEMMGIKPDKIISAALNTQLLRPPSEKHKEDEEAANNRISRLTERHLLQGVKYFQLEIDRITTDPKIGVGGRSNERVLLEACAAIANLSTVKLFRQAMVHIGVINTLLKVYDLRAGSPALKSICSATLHRLALEEEAKVDNNGLLIPSLLAILRQTDDELHQVRYECEKISLLNKPSSPMQARSPKRKPSILFGPHSPQKKNSQTGGNLSPTRRSSVEAVSAATKCVQQSYRDPKWTVYVLKTVISSASMIPQLEKKQMKSIGQPKISFRDLEASSHYTASTPRTTPPPATAPAASAHGHPGPGGAGAQSTTSTARPRSGGLTNGLMSSHERSDPLSADLMDSRVLPPSHKKGYLMSVHKDKYVIRNTDMFGGQSLPTRTLSMSSVSTSLRDGQDLETIMHARKFDRHMRVTRRNHRRNPTMLPVLSMEAKPHHPSRGSPRARPTRTTCNRMQSPMQADEPVFPRSKAVILIGGPNQQGNHFRPLSLDLPKPLFPIAGHEMMYFHVEACARLPNLIEIIMIGSYDEGLFTRFFDSMARRFNVAIRYLKEDKPLGTAGGIRCFRHEILQNDPASLFVLHCDVCCSFPLNEMMHFHLRHPGQCTVLGKRVFHEEAKKYGCLVQDPQTKQIMHWAEKPETFVSDIINCGIYLFDVALMDVIVRVGDEISRQRQRSESNAEVCEGYDLKKLFPEFSNLNNLRLEQDVLLPLAGQGSIYLFETGDFWCQIKTPGMAVTCSELYMQRFRYTNPTALSSTGGKLSPQIEGNVVIDPTAQVHPTAKLGPNVCVAAGVTIGPGARVAHSIILEGVTIKAHACVLFSIIGWNSIVGQWARVEGQPPNSSQIRVHSAESALVRDVTIFGVSVVANPEVVVRNCVVLPHKTLTQSYHDEILL
ncbi:TPA: hypothetical protein N0F65_006266 [Lagenidium giganteum]|uniref:Uncharacterized protein n=1 Tax=Lagenidium giganteum TaxID=4803 RepID=A0AAV2Z5C3_9STRA|nr:TPA: hypothetical protein N0F65_006266 [Lagenidium giganteum]